MRRIRGALLNSERRTSLVPSAYSLIPGLPTLNHRMRLCARLGLAQSVNGALSKTAVMCESSCDVQE